MRRYAIKKKEDIGREREKLSKGYRQRLKEKEANNFDNIE